MRNLVRHSSPADGAKGGGSDQRIRRKLIEVALPLEAINAASAREKSIRHGHPSTLHLWWARRPLATCRAVLFAQLVDDPSAWPKEFPTEDARKAERDRLHDLIKRLVPWEATRDEEVLNDARFEIARSFARGKGLPVPDKNAPECVLAFLTEHVPPVYDPFCGGGSIPLEAQRLGLRAMGSDLNPVAVMITKALIEFPPKFKALPPVNPEARKAVRGAGAWSGRGAEGIAEDVRYYGQWIRDRAAERIGHLYPKARLEDGSEATVIAWLWARTVRCPNPACQRETPLITSFVLSSKKGKERYLSPICSDGGLSFKVGDTPPTSFGDPKKGLKRGMSGIFECVHCETVTKRDYVADEGCGGRLGAIQTAVVAKGPKGRIYLGASTSPVSYKISEIEDTGLNVDLAPNPRDVWCRNFGLRKPLDLFTPRQLIALTTFSDLVAEARAEVLAAARNAFIQDPARRDDSTPLAEGGKGPEAYADAVAVYLSFAVDKATDYWSSLCSWHSSREIIRNTFGRQALPMVWDYAECNPFSGSTGNWLACVDWVQKSVAACPAEGCAEVWQQNARNPRAFDEPVLMIATDPPYYDNIGYADLSDFFYVWLRRALKDRFSKLFASVLTPKTDELVASSYRHDGSRAAAQCHFENGMQQAIRQMYNQTDDGVPVSIYYAFKQTEMEQEGVASTGWATFLEGVIKSGFQVDGTWPTRTELSNRMVGHGTNALASSIVLVCRKRPYTASTIGKSTFLRELRRDVPRAILHMLKSGIPPVDLAQAAIGPGMAVFSRYAAVLEQDDSAMSVREALKIINAELDVILSEEEVDYDRESRFAIIWFKQYAFDSGPFDDANKIGTAQDVSVKGVEEAGLVHARGGKVRLLRRDELPAEYDPWKDERQTVWEGCQHLIKRLEDDGEEAAARLAKKLGYQADVAKDLAYRLYQICDRKGWAEEARAYNGLVTAWPEIQRLVESLPDATASIDPQASLPLDAA